MDLPETEDLLNSLPTYDLVYLSAITLSLYSEDGRRALLGGAEARTPARHPFCVRHQFSAPAAGSTSTSRAVPSARPFEAADIVLGFDRDLLPLYPKRHQHETLLAGICSPEVVLKLAEPATIVRLRRHDDRSEGRAGDETSHRHHRGRRQFAAAYVAARLSGAEPVRRRAPAIVWPASWCAIPAPSSRATPCRRRKRPDHAISRKASQ